MEAWITKSFGDYVVKYRSHDLKEVRRIAAIVEAKIGIKVKDNVY